MFCVENAYKAAFSGIFTWAGILTWAGANILPSNLFFALVAGVEYAKGW